MSMSPSAARIVMEFPPNQDIIGSYKPSPLVDGKMLSKLNTLPTIRLQDPLLHNSFTKGKFTSYKILIETEHHAFHLRVSCIRRRYSELRWLCSTLQAHHKQIKLPPIPSKKIWSERFNANFVSTRMKEMEVFLNDLIQIDTILSDTALHLFLQTDMIPEEMDSYLNGDMADEQLDKIWHNQGHLHTANELGTFLSIATPREIAMDSEDEMLASSNSPASTMSTHFNNLNLNANNDNNLNTTNNGDTNTDNNTDNHTPTQISSPPPSSSPAKTTTATTASPKKGGFNTPPPIIPDNKQWLPKIPEISNESSNRTESESTYDTTTDDDNDIRYTAKPTKFPYTPTIYPIESSSYTKDSTEYPQVFGTALIDNTVADSSNSSSSDNNDSASVNNDSASVDNNDSASVVTVSTDNSTRNSSPDNLSEEIQQGVVTMSTYSDLSPV